jgi:hypothetical protein
MLLETSETKQIAKTSPKVGIVHRINDWIEHRIGIAEPKEKFSQHLKFAFAEDFAAFLEG